MCFIHKNKSGHCGLVINQSISELDISKHSVSQTTKTKTTKHLILIIYCQNKFFLGHNIVIMPYDILSWIILM